MSNAWTEKTKMEKPHVHVLTYMFLLESKLSLHSEQNCYISLLSCEICVWFRFHSHTILRE